jgi:hypothetical protein
MPMGFCLIDLFARNTIVQRYHKSYAKFRSYCHTNVHIHKIVQVAQPNSWHSFPHPRNASSFYYVAGTIKIGLAYADQSMKIQGLVLKFLSCLDLGTGLF